MVFDEYASTVPDNFCARDNYINLSAHAFWIIRMYERASAAFLHTPNFLDGLSPAGSPLLWSAWTRRLEGARIGDASTVALESSRRMRAYQNYDGRGF